MGKSIRVTAVLFIFALLLGCGDGKKDTTGKDTTQNQTENGTGNQTSTPDNNTTAGENEAGDKPGANELGMKDGLPADFPADVPQPPESKVLGYLSSSEGTNVSFESSKTIKEIADFYKAEMGNGGYNVKPDGEEINESSAMIYWAKGAKEVSLVVVEGQNNNTSIVVTYK